MMRKILPFAILLLSSFTFGWDFHLIDQYQQKTIGSGLLIATKDSNSKSGNVCHNYFNYIAATVICKEMGYIGSQSWSSRYRWTSQGTELINIRCYSPRQTIEYCTFSELGYYSSCNVVSLDCEGCPNNYFTLNETCIKCPLGSKTTDPNSESCNCTAGSVWKNSTETCQECPENTYSRGNSTHCTQCPENSSSRPGAGECDCDRNFYKPGSEEGCWKCPPDTTSTPGSTFCSCTSGLFFSLGYCQTCPSDTYSSGNVTRCETCPPGSSSLSGAAVCECSGGLFMNSSGLCQPCEGDSYSYQGSSSCTACPGNYTSALYQSYCECPAGMYWNYPLKNCVECPPDHYNDQTNQTRCNECPEHSSSQSRSERCSCKAGYKLLNISHCEICPENHFSQAGSLSCQPCPHFKVAAPGSEHCYRCTPGQYWENHTCIQCPEHLYGDGVQCMECPEEFQVDKGLCYKVADRNSLANVVRPLETAIIAVGSILLLICVLVGMIMVWIAHSSRSTTYAANVDESELQRLQPANEDAPCKKLDTDLDQDSDIGGFDMLLHDHDLDEIFIESDVGNGKMENDFESGSAAEVKSNIYEDI